VFWAVSTASVLHGPDGREQQGGNVRRLAIFVVHRRWWVIAVAVLVLPLAAFVAKDTAHRLSPTGYQDPGAESSRAARSIAAEFPAAAQSDFVVVVTARDPGGVDAPEVARAATALGERLARADGVGSVNSYWSLDNAPPLRSRDGSKALIVSALTGDEGAKTERARELVEEFTVRDRHITTAVSGVAAVTGQIAKQAEKDLARADLITAPITFIALVIVFGSLVAALLPLGVGGIAVLLTMVFLTALSTLTTVSVFALNLTTALGLGLAIDYSLFVVSRYREEIGNGVSSSIAVGRTMQTAGRTVAFSAGTVAISLASLAIFPVPYLRSFAYAGVTVVLLAAGAAIVVLPAVLAALGRRVDAGRVFHTAPTTDSGFWRHQAMRVMHHPAIYAIGVSAILVVLAIPFFHFNPGLADDRIVPRSVSSRAATDEIRKNFSSREADALTVFVPGYPVRPDRSAVDAFAKRLVLIRGVSRVDAATGYYLPVDGSAVVAPRNDLSTRFDPRASRRGTWISIVPTVEPYSDAGARLVRDVRATDAGFTFEVAGPSAQFVDTRAAVIARMPWALGAIALCTFVLLFLMTGSLLVPLKALLLNMLSLTATFGAMVWIFQDGHLSGVLGFTPTGSLDVFTPILMFCIAFGLSMDYEVFLISRIKEEYDLERDNEHAVAVGIQKTGRIVTAAALLLTIVFVGIATSQVSIVKTVGVGLTLAVLVDAFLIRATLVPAFMKMAGRLNWWSPKFLRRWHLRYGIWENEPIALLDRQFEASVR
jgi:RND superfamily putative drug exporter